MASPTFDSVALFDSTRAGSSTKFTEGVLCLTGYTKIKQKLHFSGEDGDRYLDMGYPDREWVFEGLLSHTSYSGLAASIRAIEAKIDTDPGDSASYKVLVDSFGTIYAKALITDWHFTSLPHIEVGGGYFCGIRVTGIVQGSSSNQEGASSSSGA